MAQGSSFPRPPTLLARAGSASAGLNPNPNPALTVVIWTVPDGSGTWATEAAADLWQDELFYDPSKVQLSLQAFGDTYMNNTYACNAEPNVWNVKDATCWLSNCSAPWPPTKAMTNAECYGEPQHNG